VVRNKTKKLPLLVQAAALKREFPSSDLRRNHYRIDWRGKIQPTAFSETYTVRIEYLVSGKRPTVTVISPELIPNEDGKLPHIFPGRRLCLHHAADWGPWMLISQTIVPWTSEYLLHYEFWRATGKWSGGGHEPVLYRADEQMELFENGAVKRED
jgi:hypothetical protein